MFEIVEKMINQTKDYFERGMDKLADLLIDEDIARSSMVLAAWISSADGTITENEIAETEKFINETEYFEEKDHPKLIKVYREWCRNFIKNPEDALVYAFAEIAPLANRPEAVNAVQLAYKIAQSDHVVTESELKIITKVCIVLGVICDDEYQCVLRH
ncbi:MAG: tellurite resistance TerB family protein [Desulfamplus sp.]|nr:tellurite resistance TerB family protein [Desulfamplus sp.]